MSLWSLEGGLPVARLNVPTVGGSSRPSRGRAEGERGVGVRAGERGALPVGSTATPGSLLKAPGPKLPAAAVNGACAGSFPGRLPGGRRTLLRAGGARGVTRMRASTRSFMRLHLSATVRLRVTATSPGTLVVGRHAARQAQLRDQRGLPGPPPALRRPLPHLLLQRGGVGGLRGHGFGGVLPRAGLLGLRLRLLRRLLLPLGPLLGKRHT